MSSASLQLSNKSKFLNRFRKRFTNKFFEKIFLLFVDEKTGNNWTYKIIPQSYLYPQGSYREATRYGINFKLDLSDYLDWLLYFYSKSDSSFGLLNYLDNARTVIDVGGNIGQTGLAIAKKLGKESRIISFEPYPSTFNRYMNNLGANPGTTNIKVENLALGDKEAVLDMFVESELNSGRNRIVFDKMNNTQGTVQVKVTTLDKYVLENNLPAVDFIKIDVEGFEHAVLKGAVETLKKDKPVLYIELSDGNLRSQGSSSLELVKFLNEIGYTAMNAVTKTVVGTDTIVEPHIDIVCSPKK
jgi:FkbM family methyltransferase